MLLNYKDQLQYLVDRSKELGVYDICSPVLENDYFHKWPASSSHHHSYTGGLVTHTYEVAALCEINSSFYQYYNNKLLFIAAVYHDFAKIYDYQPKLISENLYNRPPINSETQWEDAKYKKLIGHVSGSAMYFSNSVGHSLAPNQRDEIIHAILSHHQLKEWGSPVQPQTKMAWLLHLCDNMSARLTDLGKHKFWDK